MALTNDSTSVSSNPFSYTDTSSSGSPIVLASINTTLTSINDNLTTLNTTLTALLTRLNAQPLGTVANPIHYVTP